jgi:hypothetical protein
LSISQVLASVKNGTKVYHYKKMGEIVTWVGQDGLPVAVLLHPTLREKAIAEGTPVDVFLSPPRPVMQKPELDLCKELPKQTKKKNFSNSINPFNLGGK